MSAFRLDFQTLLLLCLFLCILEPAQSEQNGIPDYFNQSGFEDSFLEERFLTPWSEDASYKFYEEELVEALQSNQQGTFFLEANTIISDDILHSISSYVMSEDHPIKQQLDEIFSQTRVLSNLKSFRNAGFKTKGPRKHTQILVAYHKKFPNYVFKVLLDSQFYYYPIPLYELWAKRIKGALLVREQIDANGWNGIFKVPQKFIYILPPEPAAIQSKNEPKNFILVQDNMEILASKYNHKIWKGEGISQDLLKALFVLVSNVGLTDLKPDNIPIAKDGRIAFVDTELHSLPVGYDKLTSFLSEKNKKYWVELIKEKKQKDHVR